MKYVITGAAGHISRPLALQLLQAGHSVTVIGRDAAKLKPLTDAGATAAIGSVEDVDFLTNAFAGADAVYTMVPPRFDITNGWKQWIASIGKNYAAAIRANNIRYVVNLSSVGAHLPDGCGPVSGLYHVEQTLNALDGVNVKHLRPVYFFSNLLANVGMVKHMNIIGANYGGPGFVFAMVDTNDIAAVAFEALQSLSFTGKSHQYIASDERPVTDIAAVLGKAIGNPSLPWITFTDEQSYAGMLQAGLTEEMATNYTEMGHAINNGSMMADYFAQANRTLSPAKLEDFAVTFAYAYNQ